MSREEFVQSIINAVDEARQKDYPELTLKMDLSKILDQLEDGIKDYNITAIEELRNSFENHSPDYYSYDEILDQVLDNLY